MRRTTLLIAALGLLLVGLGSHQPGAAPVELPDAPPAGDSADVRFLAFDVLIDPHGRPLAAYQIEVTSAAGPRATLVGIEGGEGAYAQPPYYDPKALHPPGAGSGDGPDRPERVILAALAIAPSEPGAVAPTAESRVARLHYMLEGDGEPSLAARLMVAGADENTPIEAAIRLVPLPPADP